MLVATPEQGTAAHTGRVSLLAIREASRVFGSAVAETVDQE